MFSILQFHTEYISIWNLTSYRHELLGSQHGIRAKENKDLSPSVIWSHCMCLDLVELHFFSFVYRSQRRWVMEIIIVTDQRFSSRFSNPMFLSFPNMFCLIIRTASNQERSPAFFSPGQNLAFMLFFQPIKAYIFAVINHLD